MWENEEQFLLYVFAEYHARYLFGRHVFLDFMLIAQWGTASSIVVIEFTPTNVKKYKPCVFTIEGSFFFGNITIEGSASAKIPATQYVSFFFWQMATQYISVCYNMLQFFFCDTKMLLPLSLVIIVFFNKIKSFKIIIILFF